MRKKNKYHPYYVGRRNARISFLAGLCTCLLLVAATACVIFAVLMSFELPSSQEMPVFAEEPANYIDSAVDFLESDEEAGIFAASWVQVIPPRDEFENPEHEVFEEVPEPEEMPELEEIPEIEDFEDINIYENLPHIEIAPTPTPIPIPEPNMPREPAPPIAFEYTLLSFYLPENAVSYAEFQRERPDLDTETVMWMVNSSVHVPFYSQIFINNEPDPLFVSPAYRLPDGFTPHTLVPVNNEACNLRATPEAVAAFRAFRAAAQNAGHSLSVASAFRSSSRQSELWENGGRRDGRVARPFHSEHQTGRALDLWGPGGLLDADGPTNVGRWVAANAHEYGFLIRYRAETTHITGYIHEPWHITYVGTEISMYMHENNILSLEEFVGRNPQYLRTVIL